MKSFLFCFILIFFFSGLYADQEDPRFQQANEAYQSDDYDRAIQLYRSLYDEGFRSPELEYNLGNTYFRLQNLGGAVLHYERALLLAPEDPDIQHNLALARDRIEDDFDPIPVFFLTAWWHALRQFASSSAWAVLALVLWWFGLAGLGIYLLGKTRQQKKTGFITGLTLMLISILPFALAFSRMKYEQNSNRAIVMAKETSLRSAPDSSGSEVVTLHAGTKVKLLEMLSGWWQVQLPNGENGWLNEKDLEEI